MRQYKVKEHVLYKSKSTCACVLNVYYGVAKISRLLKIIDLFCKRAL